MQPTPQSASPSLAGSVLSGASWLGLSRLCAQGLSLVSVAFVARILPPRAYGLVGMAQLVVGFMTVFQDLGTNAAVIQRRELEPRFLSTVWWLNLAVSCSLAAVCWIFSPLVAVFYREPAITHVLRVLSLNFIVVGASGTHSALLCRRLDFRSIAFIEITSGCIGLATAVSLAYSGAGVWALVGASLTTTASNSALLMARARWMPYLSFSWFDVRSTSRFGLNLSAFNLVNYFARNADNALIGRYLGATPLGYYQLAYNLMLYPVQSIAQTFGRVLFPALAKMQDDYPRFRVAYLRACAAIAFLTFPMMTGALILADEIVRVVLGPKWLPVVPVFRLLAPIGMVQSLSTTVGQIYIATGRTDLMFRWGVLFTLPIIGSFVAGLPWGIQGVAAAYAIVVCCILVPVFWLAFRIIDLPLVDLWRAVWPGLKCTLVMAAAVLLLRYGLVHISSQSYAIRLLICSAGGAGLYFGLMFRNRPPVLEDMIHLKSLFISAWQTRGMRDTGPGEKEPQNTL
jgi:PST family polysaccharide transporter